MNFLKLTVLIFLFSISQNGMCQDKIQTLRKSKYNFKYQNQLYKYFELDEIILRTKTQKRRIKILKRQKRQLEYLVERLLY